MQSYTKYEVFLRDSIEEVEYSIFVSAHSEQEAISKATAHSCIEFIRIEEYGFHLPQ